MLSLLSAALFVIELAPLELQRRIVNGAVDNKDFRFTALLCPIYAAVTLAQSGLKLVLNVYRGPPHTGNATSAESCVCLRITPRQFSMCEIEQTDEGFELNMVDAFLRPNRDCSCLCRIERLSSERRQ